MIVKIHKLLILAAVFAIAGCDFKSSGRTDWLACVDGEVLSVEGAKAKVELSLALIRTFYPKAIEKSDDFVKIRNDLAANVPKWWVDSVLLRHAARRLGVTIEEEDLERCRNDYMQGHKFQGTYVDFIVYTRADRALLDYDIETETLKKAVLLHEYPDLRGLSEAQVAEVRARYEDFNRVALTTNAVKMALATNVYRQVAAGVDFQKAGEKHGELFREQEKFWKKLTPADFAEQVLKDWAFSAKVGEVSPPLDLEDGISIVKVLKKKDGVITETPLAENIAEVELARMTFKALATIKVPNDEELRANILKFRMQESEREFFGKLREAAKAEYPLGEDFVSILYTQKEVVK